MKSLTDGKPQESQELQKQDSEAHALQLKKQSEGLITILIESAKKLDDIIEIEHSLTIAKAIEGLPLQYHVKQNGRKALCQALDIQVTRLAASINVKHNLSSMQIQQIVSDIVETFPTETLEDFLLVFKRARQGYYSNEIYKLDQATIFAWIRMHLEEKSAELERIRINEDAEREKIQKEKLNNDQLTELYQNAFDGKFSGPPAVSRRTAMGFGNDPKYEQFRAEQLKKFRDKQKQHDLDADTQKKILNHDDQIKASPEKPERGRTDEAHSRDEQDQS